MFSILLSTTDWKHQKVKAKFLEIVLFKNSITWFLGAWHGFWLAEFDSTVFICFQWIRGKVRVCLGNACSSELHYALMHHRFSSTMLLRGAFCSLAWQMACTNPIAYRCAAYAQHKWCYWIRWLLGQKSTNTGRCLLPADLADEAQQHF